MSTQREQVLQLDPGDFALLLCLMAHDFHHDFMHLGVGRVTDAMFVATNTIKGGNGKRKARGTSKSTSSSGNRGKRARVSERVTRAPYKKFRNKTVISKTRRTATRRSSDHMEEVGQIHEGVVYTVGGFDEVINDIVTSMIHVDDTQLKKIMGKMKASDIDNIRNDMELYNLISGGIQIMKYVKYETQNTGNPLKRKSLEGTYISNTPVKEPLNSSGSKGSNPGSAPSDPLQAKVTSGNKRQKLMKPLDYKSSTGISAVKTFASKLGAGALKKGRKKKSKVSGQNKKRANKLTRRMLKKHIWGGSSRIRIPRGGPIKIKEESCKKIKSDLTQLQKVENDQLNIEVYEEIVTGWNDAYDSYESILALNDSGIKNMDELNRELLKKFSIRNTLRVGVKPFKFMGNYETNGILYEDSTNPSSLLNVEELYNLNSNTVPGNPSESFKPALATCLCLLVRSNFFDTNREFLYQREPARKVKVDFAWYFSEKMTQLGGSMAVRPSFKAGIDVSENLSGYYPGQTLDNLKLKYKMRGSNTFARYIELIKEAGIDIPLFKRPSLSSDQRATVKKLGKDISLAWHGFIKAGISGKMSEPVNKIMKSLQTGVSTDTKVLDIIKNHKELWSQVKEFNDKPLDTGVVNAYTRWKDKGGLNKEVMDNAAPLGKSNWARLYNGPPNYSELDIKRNNYIPRALDAAGSSIIESKLSDISPDEYTIYVIKGGPSAINRIMLKYKDTPGDESMDLTIEYGQNTLQTSWDTSLGNIKDKPLSVKGVIQKLFQKIKDLTDLGAAGVTDMNDMLSNISKMVIPYSKGDFFRDHILPVIMLKLSGDFGQEVVACGGIYRNGKYNSITQTHNDIPAFLRGLLLSAKSKRGSEVKEGVGAAPVIYQTSHNGKYWPKP
jgi:hypothetical protein